MDEKGQYLATHVAAGGVEAYLNVPAHYKFSLVEKDKGYVAEATLPGEALLVCQEFQFPILSSTELLLGRASRNRAAKLRDSRGDPADQDQKKWSKVAMNFTAWLHETGKLTDRKRAQVTKLYMDNLYDGRQKAKGKKGVEKDEARVCELCSAHNDSQDHWILQCPCGGINEVRIERLDYIRKQLEGIPEAAHRRLAMGVYEAATTAGGSRICVGLWDWDVTTPMLESLLPEGVTAQAITETLQTVHIYLVEFALVMWETRCRILRDRRNELIPSEAQSEYVRIRQVNRPPMVYAVRVGKYRGIFDNKADFRLAIRGVKGGAFYRRCSSQEEAYRYMTIGMAPEDLHMVEQIQIFTDGSCLHPKDRPWTAGWGVVTFLPSTPGKELEEPYNRISEAWGCVCLNPLSENYVGAEKNTNNSAELSAISQALNQIGKMKHGYPILIRSDSHLAIHATLGLLTKQQRKTNVAIVKGIEELYRKVSEKHRIYIEHVPAHADVYGNEEADKMAKRGAGSEDEYKEELYNGIDTVYGGPVFPSLSPHICEGYQLNINVKLPTIARYHQTQKLLANKQGEADESMEEHPYQQSWRSLIRTVPIVEPRGQVLVPENGTNEGVSTVRSEYIDSEQVSEGTVVVQESQEERSRQASVEPGISEVMKKTVKTNRKATLNMRAKALLLGVSNPVITGEGNGAGKETMMSSSLASSGNQLDPHSDRWMEHKEVKEYFSLFQKSMIEGKDISRNRVATQEANVSGKDRMNRQMVTRQDMRHTRSRLDIVYKTVQTDKDELNQDDDEDGDREEKGEESDRRLEENGPKTKDSQLQEEGMPQRYFSNYMTDCQYRTQIIVHGLYAPGAWCYEYLISEYLDILRKQVKTRTLLMETGISMHAFAETTEVFTTRCKETRILRQLNIEVHEQILIPVVVHGHCWYIEYWPKTGVVIKGDSMGGQMIPEELLLLLEIIRKRYSGVPKLMKSKVTEYQPRQQNSNDCGIYLMSSLTLLVYDKWDEYLALICPPMIQYIRTRISILLIWKDETEKLSPEDLMKGVLMLSEEDQEAIKNSPIRELQQRWEGMSILWRRPAHRIPDYLPPLKEGGEALGRYYERMARDGLALDRLEIVCYDVVILNELNNYLAHSGDILRYHTVSTQASTHTAYLVQSAREGLG